MLRRHLLLLPFLPAPPKEDFDARVLEFHKLWNTFIRTYWGCSDEARTTGDCRVAIGRLDRRMWERLRREAMKTFDLEEHV